GTLPDQLEGALETMCTTLGIEGGCVALREGPAVRIAAVTGETRPQSMPVEQAGLPDDEQIVFDAWPLWPAARLLIPLRLGDLLVGTLAFGAKRSGAPYTESERALLASLASYLALAVRHHRRQQEEQLALAALAEQARQLQAEHNLLLAQAAETRRAELPGEAAANSKGLRVYALGPLRVERDGELIERWGGDKAGTYQAEALFALLFERRGRGVTKDEAAEVIWPDLTIERADMAFHRTVSALRRTLEPGLRRGNQSKTISFHHERYWLNPECIGWDDLEAFSGALEHGRTLLRNGEYDAARACFVQAGEWYRGDYLDDCPFVGDSHYVEQRRGELREQCVDGFVVLGSIYEHFNQIGEAVTCYRRALALADGDCPRADEALERVQHKI
ncbi:MAG TPA: GAF domain-containing protein, partial [Roseiflexaceae bacterium]|nr:GAF domain-containing protein [Roseiflexaceae bacterium]